MKKRAKILSVCAALCFALGICVLAVTADSTDVDSAVIAFYDENGQMADAAFSSEGQTATFAAFKVKAYKLFNVVKESFMPKNFAAPLPLHSACSHDIIDDGVELTIKKFPTFFGDSEISGTLSYKCSACGSTEEFPIRYANANVFSAVNTSLQTDKTTEEEITEEIISNPDESSLDFKINQMVNEYNDELPDGEGADVYAVDINDATGEPMVQVDMHKWNPGNLVIEGQPSRPLNNMQTIEGPALSTSIAVGDTRVITYDDRQSSPIDYTLECVYTNEVCTVWADKDATPGIKVGATVGERIGDEFAEKYYALTSSFGDIYDSDADGKLAIYCYDIDNNFDPANPGGFRGAYTGGFFDPYDLIGWPYVSAAHDCIHIDTYPSMVTSPSSLNGKNVDEPESCLVNPEKAFSVLVHEGQHLINFSNYSLTQSGYYNGKIMSTYLNEAFSMAAEHMICGESAVSSRISYFNDAYSSYVPGTSLTYWLSDMRKEVSSRMMLSNYANSYLFGQYIRTQYAQKESDGQNGGTIFKQVIDSGKDEDELLGFVADLLGTNEKQLVRDFWSAVYLKEKTGRYGFNGDSWADSIQAKVYESLNDPQLLALASVYGGYIDTLGGRQHYNAGNIQDGGCWYFKIPNGKNPFEDYTVDPHIMLTAY